MLKQGNLSVGGTSVKNVTIYAGEFYITHENLMLSTLVGSCVAVCLYDPVTHLAGMNHFLLANKQYAKDLPICLSEAGRYGVHAMELLINGLMKKGAVRNRLEAKAFGGGNILGVDQSRDFFMAIGEINCRFILEFLKNENIKLVAADLGGEQGRFIHFHVRDFVAYVRKIKKVASTKVAQDERAYWEKSITEHERSAPEPKIWK